MYNATTLLKESAMIDNLKSLTFKQWLTVAFVGVFFTVAPACIRQWKQVDTPAPIVEMGVPAKVSLADTPAFQDQTNEQFALWMKQWDNNEASAEQSVQLFEGILSVAKDPKTLMSLGLNPAGGVFSTLLLLGGLVTPTPGHAKSKRDSFNKGAEEALKAVEVGKAIVNETK